MKTALKLLLTVCVVAAPWAAWAQDAPLVLTGTQATYSLTKALTAGTPIEVQNVPADGRPFGLLKDYIARRADTLAPTFQRATAVVRGGLGRGVSAVTLAGASTTPEPDGRGTAKPTIGASAGRRLGCDPGVGGAAGLTGAMR